MSEENAIKVTIEWQKHDGDGTPCGMCNEPIYSKMFILCFTLMDGEKWDAEPLCASCYDLTNENPE